MNPESKKSKKRKPNGYASRIGASFEGLKGYLNVPLSAQAVRNPLASSYGEVQTRRCWLDRWAVPIEKD